MTVIRIFDASLRGAPIQGHWVSAFDHTVVGQLVAGVVFGSKYLELSVRFLSEIVRRI